MSLEIVIFGPAIIFLLFLIMGLKSAAEYERFAIFRVGRFLKFRGPGVMFRFPGSNDVWVKIAIGDRGELSAEGIGKFNKVQIPVLLEGKADAGSMIRIKGFKENVPIVEVDANQRKTVKCEKCGHEMEI